MRTGSKIIAVAMAGCLNAAVAGSAAIAADLNVVSTPGPMPEVMGALVPLFERASGHKVAIKFQAAPATISQLKEGAGIDLLIADEEVINDFVKDGLIAAGGGTRVMLSRVGVAVRAGAPKPDIGSTEAVKKALLAAKSIGYSTGPSGVYLVDLFQRLGIADQVKPKLKQTPTGVFVGGIVASGEAEIGFQQVSELSQFAGVDYVGPLPADIQQITVFASGIQVGAKQADAANAWVKFLASPAAAPAFKKRGLEHG
jgi:molybdate transport system substrate-binding protein